MYFNGQKVHTEFEANQVWGGANSGIDGDNDGGKGITDTPGGLKLQCEGHDVRYRNTWIKELNLEQPVTDFNEPTVTEAAIPKTETVQHLFNEKDLSGWQGDPSRWSVVQGMIRGANEDKVTSSTYLFTDKKFRNFRLLLEVKQTMSDRHSTMHSAVARLANSLRTMGKTNLDSKGHS